MYLIFDIGGTNMRLAVSRDGRELNAQKTIPTPVDDFEKAMRQIKEVAEELAGGEKFAAIAGGTAGSLDTEHGVLLRAPHMPGWIQKPLKKELDGMFSAPVYLENDATFAGLGEATAGAAKGYVIAVYVAVGTGVGGARIVDGVIDRNVSGFEPGHQIINYDGDIRTLEEYVSGSGFLGRFGKLPESITDSGVWEEAAQLLAVGLSNTILHWSPDILVLGGSVILHSPFPFDLFKEYLTTHILSVFPAVPEVKKAALGDVSGLQGALVFLHTAS